MNASPDQRSAILVTGGSRGIGREIALEAARRGYNVALTYNRDCDAASAVVENVEAIGGRALALRARAEAPDEMEGAVADAYAFLGRLDGLVTNAGVVGRLCGILDVDAGYLGHVFGVNVFGVYYAIAAAARRMSTQHGGAGGVILNMSSVAARSGGMPQESAYASSKGAVDSLTLALAKELPPHGIRINALRPGMIATEIHEVHGGEVTLKAIAPQIPLGRVGTPAEVAAAAMFLLGPESAYIHGALIDIGGGR